MFLELFLSMLGSWSRGLIEWLNNNPLNLILIYGTWMLVWGAGKLQLKRNISFLEENVLNLAKQLSLNGEKVNENTIYQIVHQAWQQKIHRLAWFIPHQSELWPIPARFEIVKRRIGFSPEWVRKYLEKNHLLDEPKQQQ